MGKSSKKSTSSVAISSDNRRSKHSKHSNGATTTAGTTPHKKNHRSKEFPIIPMSIFFSIVGIILYIPYQRYGMTIFRNRIDWNLTQDEWELKMQNKKILLIGGPHRGGTSILWKCLKEGHPLVSGFGTSFETGVDESEGILMQDVYPQFGIGLEDFRTKFPNWSTSGQGVGQYALHQDVHMTERHELVSSESRIQLWNRFGPHWDFRKTVLMEKSPPTIVMSRFLQALHSSSSVGGEQQQQHPQTYFIFTTRHPLAVLLATEQMMGKDYLPFDRVMENYVQMYRYLKEDLPYLLNTPQLVPLEEFAQNPQGTLERLFTWLGLDDNGDDYSSTTATSKIRLPETIHKDPNAKYQKRWCQEPGLQRLRASLIQKYQPIFTTELSFLGYDLTTWCDGF